MKLLIHNYADHKSSEPIYLYQALQYANIDVAIWSDPNASAFDVFDRAKPDVFITHYRFITNDILTYLNQSSKNIRLVVNVTDASETQLDSIKSVLPENYLLFTNSFNGPSGVETIYPAADIFQQPSNDFNLPNLKKLSVGLISDKNSDTLQEIAGKNSVYHILYMGEDKDYADFDLRADVRSLKRIMKLYEQIHLVGDSNLCTSQLFFDLCLFSDNLRVTSTEQEKFNKTMSKIFDDVSDVEDVQKEMKSQVKLKHTPFHRAARLMKMLGEKRAMQSLETIKSQLGELMKDL
jgi:hypothetical protein|tara:strand:- start:1781 stop:2659 length:879 start_codon:yes stop_codon:yes gene_type:complete